MTKRTTDDWKALLVPELPKKLWVEGSDWDDEDWEVCVQHSKWGDRSSIGSAYSPELAYLFAAAPEAAAEVVRLREELGALRDTLSKARIDIARGDYEYGQHTAFLMVSSQLTRILEGDNDGHA